MEPEVRFEAGMQLGAKLYLSYCVLLFNSKVQISFIWSALGLENR